MFRICDNKGFQITFENGWTISVQFGFWNYCDNLQRVPQERHGEPVACRDAEIAVITPSGKFWPIEDEDVIGYQNPNQVLAIMNKIAAFPKE